MRIAIVFAVTLFAVSLFPSQLRAQTTEFTYRGILGGSPTGTYDFEFRLFDVTTGGTALAVQQRLGVFVEAGQYQAQVDFGNEFPVADRHLEIGYKNGPGPFITISPREPLTVNAVTQYNINGIRVLSNAGSQNLFVGESTGPVNSGVNNTFVGGGAGYSNTSGRENSFFGRTSGTRNTTGWNNSFFGWDSARWNTNGYSNSFFGTESGYSNTSGHGNTFVGSSSGKFNTTGNKNTAIGQGSGFEYSAGNLAFATAIGADSRAALSNSVYLGRPYGEDTVRIPGNLNVTGSTTLNGNLVFASGGIALFQSMITLTSLGSSGSFHICRNSSNQLSSCSSSLRYKTNINSFSTGLNLVHRLKPITFVWKDGGMHDLGLGAEDVAAIEPLLVTYNKNGEVEGVKYDRIAVVLVNAVKEQQAQIEKQNREIAELQKLLATVNELKHLVCAKDPELTICKEKP